MKITQKQLSELLEAIGIGAVEVVEDESKADYSSDAAIEAIDANRSPIFKSKFRDELTGQVRGQLGGNIRTALARHTGFSRAALDKIEDDGEAIREAFAYKMSLVEGDKTSAQEQIQKLIDNHNAALAALAAEKDGEITAWQKKYNDHNAVRYYNSRLKDQPIGEKADREFIAKLWKQAIDDKYTAKYDEAKEAMAYYDKSKPDQLALNDAGNSMVDDVALLKDIATKLGVWETDTRNVNPYEAQQRGANNQKQNDGLPEVPGYSRPRGLEEFNKEFEKALETIK